MAFFNTIKFGCGPSQFLCLSRSMSTQMVRAAASSIQIDPLLMQAAPLQVNGTPSKVNGAPSSFNSAPRIDKSSHVNGAKVNGVPKTLKTPKIKNTLEVNGTKTRTPLKEVTSKKKTVGLQSVDLEAFSRMSPIERIKAIYEVHGEHAMQLASMQKTSGVVMHLIHSAGVKIPVLFFDTEYLFQETIDLKNEFEKRYGLNILTITPQLTPKQQDRLYGTDLWKTRAGQVQCCYMRKEKPLTKAIGEHKIQATLSGLMRKEGGARASVKPVDLDPRTNTIVYNPLFDWTNKEIHAYTKKHNIPVHSLYAKNFLSIGCAPCTTPVKTGEHPRAGRWRHLRKDGNLGDAAYCGMNYTDVGRKKKKKLGGKKQKKTSYLGLKIKKSSRKKGYLGLKKV